jgi:hypothetical protein
METKQPYIILMRTLVSDDLEECKDARIIVR